MQVGELEDKRASGWGVVWGLSQGTEGQLCQGPPGVPR